MTEDRGSVRILKSTGTMSICLREWISQAQSILLNGAPNSSEPFGAPSTISSPSEYTSATPAYASLTKHPPIPTLPLHNGSNPTENHANRPVVSSRTYLTAALKIGHSLAAQLCEDETSELSNVEGDFSARSSADASNGVPPNCLKSDHVFVQFSSLRGNRDEESIISNRPLSPLQFNENINGKDGEQGIEEFGKQIGESKIQSGQNEYINSDGTANNDGMFKSNESLKESHDFEDFESNDGIRIPRNFSFSDFSVDDLLGNESAGARGDSGCVVDRGESKHADVNEIKDLFCINGARFNHNNRQGRNSKVQNKETQRKRDKNAEYASIHALGVIFYELFSGGAKLNMPPKDSSGVPHDLGGGVSNDSRYDPLPVEESKTIDLSSALELLEPLGIPTEENYDSLRKEGPIDLSSALKVIDDLNSGTNDSNSREERDSNRNKRVFGDCFASEFDSSINQLNSQLIPPIICDLVSNMIDSINGDFSGEDAYKSMSDISNDLKWMMTNLDQILNNVDPNEMITRGLLIGNSLYGRESEISQLMEAYKQSLSGVSVALISGPSGTGKSQLAMQIALISSQSGGKFLTGKYDQLQQANPFSAISSALNEYCNSLVEKGNLVHMSEMASKILAQVGGDGIAVLSKLVPSLTKLFHPQVVITAGQGDCVDAQKRIQYFLGTFLDVISSASPTGFTLFLDDLQWADSSSIQFIHQLLLRLQYSTKKNPFFFLGCFRDGEVIHNSSFQNWIGNIHNFGLTMTRIHLKGMDSECVNTMVSGILCLPPRLTRPLSDIVHHKTQGNQLFVIQLLKSLHKEGSIFVDLKRRRWDWSTEQINARGISNDVAMFLSSNLSSLPHCVKEAMSIASCFGASLEYWIAENLQNNLGVSLLGPLEDAVVEGLMDKKGDRWNFAHDKIQEASYNMMKPEDRCLHHFNYGLSLSSVALNKDNGDLLLTAVDQINRGGPNAISDKSQTSIVADLNLKAGNVSTDRSDFSTAFSFYDHGMSFLRKGHWREHYKLSLELHAKAIHCALVIGDFSSLAILSDHVMANATSFDDKLAVMYVNLRALEVFSKFPEAIEKGFAILDQLGVKNLDDPSSSWKANGLLEETENMLLRYSDGDILRLKKMEDAKKIMTMKFLGRMQFLLGIARPAAQPVATMKMVQLSLNGLSALTPIAFVLYGSLLGVLGKIREGYRYVKVALSLLNDKEIGLSNEAASEVYAHGPQVMAFVEPHQSLIDFIFRGHEIGLETGDTNSAMLCLLFHSACAYWGGKDLQWTKSSMEDNLNQMKRHNNITWITHLLQLYRSVLSMVGEDEGISTSIGKIHASGETERETFLLKRSSLLLRAFTFNKMYVAFMFRNFSEMKELAEKYQSCSIHYFMLLSHASNVFYEGLISFWLARKTNEESSRIWFDRGERARSSMKEWSNCCIWNYSNKLKLLEAEKCYCLKDVEKARHFYEASISAAAQHKFFHEEALACELAGYFFDDIGENDLAMSYFMRSHERYHSWGASAKVNHLFQVMCTRS